LLSGNIGFFLEFKLEDIMKNKNLVELGTSTRPHGIKGGFLFNLFNNDASVLIKGSVITIFPNSDKSEVPAEGQEIAIDEIHFGNKTICYLKGIRDRNIVEAMIPFKLFYPRDKFPEPDEDELYLQDLVGLKVLDIDGYEIGKVQSYFDNGAQTVLKLKLESEIVELPFVENFFPHVNLEKGTITMISPEYDS
jgi:16S rRNA processing protein RimM